MSEIDLYTMRFSPEIQQRLLSIRKIAQTVFSGAEETLCHALPAFSANGKVFMFYGAYRAHISICVGYDWVDFLKSQYPQFSFTKATIQLPHSEPIPNDIVEMIFKLISTRL